MTKTENEKSLELAKEVVTEINLNAVEVRLILEVIKQYQLKIDTAFKLKRHRSNKDFIETRQLVNKIVEKFEDINKENEKKFQDLTESKNSGKN